LHIWVILHIRAIDSNFIVKKHQQIIMPERCRARQTVEIDQSCFPIPDRSQVNFLATFTFSSLSQVIRHMVDIYLCVPDEGSKVLALSIPPSDIQRLSIHPLKWLRFVTFALAGVRGDLSATSDGPAVEYANIPHANLADAYYYTPQGETSWFSRSSLPAGN
jgi:hypothetical protein